MRVSVIITVLNEGPSIERLLQSLASQTRPPDEVVIVDGGSIDGTLEALNTWAESGRLPLRVLRKTGANISAGRNMAIQTATGDIIAATDAGVRLEPGWLEALVTPFETNLSDASSPHVVSGWFVADPQSPFETAMGATVLPQVREIQPETFLPSSRSVAFQKSAWSAVQGYPEWLDYCEDLVFDLRLRELGTFAFAPTARVHFRPRSSLLAFFKQYYRYARGDGKADLWRRRHAIRYTTYVAAGPGLLILTIVHSPWWALALLAGLGAYLVTPYRRLRTMLAPYSITGRLGAALLVPVIRVVGDVAKMLGYPAGWIWRVRNWRRPEIHWRQASARG